jgi:tRNA wybutosine-synthesizing protein 2
MFSKGNITEKLRIAAFDCYNETVVDMYAGKTKL